MNDLTGTMPLKICNITSINILTADCNGKNNSKISCKCCTECYGNDFVSD